MTLNADNKTIEYSVTSHKISAANFVLICLLASLVTVEKLGAADISQLFSKHNNSSNRLIDHSDWDKLLKKYVKPGSDGVNYIDYGGWKKSGAKALKSYLDIMQAVDVTDYGRDEQFAYWVNLYNAMTIDTVLAHYPVKSIKDIDISPGLFSNGPWKKKIATVKGTDLSLDDIEHVILRGLWKDNRVHYAVNCASIGCPNLADTAFSGVNLNKMLDNAARNYVNNPRGVTLARKKLRISKIYSWFSKDFGKNDKEIIIHLRKYADPKLSEQLKKITDIDRYEYDWNLNEFKGQT